jgi:hypothetical protein
MFFHLDLEKYPLAARVGVGVHLVACIGPFWMLYDWLIKRQKRWETWMWLSLVPWVFLWYYFEKYRPNETATSIRAERRSGSSPP